MNPLNFGGRSPHGGNCVYALGATLSRANVAVYAVVFFSPHPNFFVAFVCVALVLALLFSSIYLISL